MGRKRRIVVDTSGLLLAVVVHRRMSRIGMARGWRWRNWGAVFPIAADLG